MTKLAYDGHITHVTTTTLPKSHLTLLLDLHFSYYSMVLPRDYLGGCSPHEALGRTILKSYHIIQTYHFQSYCSFLNIDET